MVGILLTAETGGFLVGLLVVVLLVVVLLLVVVVRLVVCLVVLLVGRLVVVGFVADGDPLSVAPRGAGEVAINWMMMVMVMGRRQRMITTEAGIGGGASGCLWTGGATCTCEFFMPETCLFSTLFVHLASDEVAIGGVVAGVQR